MRIGISELIVIVVLILALFSPEKLPEYTKKFTEMLQQVKNCTKDVKDAAQPITDASQSITDLKETVNEQVSDALNGEEV